MKKFLTGLGTPFNSPSIFHNKLVVIFLVKPIYESGGSVKDRTAAQIIKDAIKNKVKHGGTIVEGTAGNTGMGIALVANALSLKSIIVVPNNQSKEKIDTLKACGADVVLVPPVPGKNPNHFTIASRIAEEMNKKDPLSAFLAGQFDNLSNQNAHCEFWS